MQTRLASFIADTPQGQEAEAILRKCVHCGFCTATCPTFQLLGDELDGPRGRIYLIKQMVEGAPVGALTRKHLDRCLSCRSCETTCPSGVEYGHLLDLGRQLAERLAPPRPRAERAKRWLIANAVSRPRLFGFAYRTGQALRPALPAALRAKLAAPVLPGDWPAPRHSRRWLVLGGCAQSAMAPSINAAAARVLDRIGISLLQVPGDGCCGALRFHLDDHEGAQGDAERLAEKWRPVFEQGPIEGIVATASGCGSFMREYARHFGPQAQVLADIGNQVSDVAELLARHADALREAFAGIGRGRRLAFQAPCTLQHGLKVRGVVEGLLQDCGFELSPVADSHLCCGSAGAYSLLQPEISARLRTEKLAALTAGRPEGIASANIGCITHLGGASPVPVRHWVEWLDPAQAP